MINNTIFKLFIRNYVYVPIGYSLPLNCMKTFSGLPQGPHSGPVLAKIGADVHFVVMFVDTGSIKIYQNCKSN